MPLYEYQCENGHRSERLQSISEQPIESCGICGAPCERVLSPPQIRFIGSGFHNTDYGTRKRGSASEPREAKTGSQRSST